MISSVTPGASAPAPSTPSPLQQARRDLASSLRSSDLDGARQAYADIIRNRPEGSSWKPDSDFAQIGKALVQGDIEAAKSAAADAIKGKIGQQPGPLPEPVPVESTGSVPSSTGGAAGSVLNVVA